MRVPRPYRRDDCTTVTVMLSPCDCQHQEGGGVCKCGGAILTDKEQSVPVSGKSLLQQFYEEGLIPANVSRIILDLPAEGIVQMKVETYDATLADPALIRRMMREVLGT